MQQNFVFSRSGGVISEKSLFFTGQFLSQPCTTNNEVHYNADKAKAKPEHNKSFDRNTFFFSG